MLYISKSSILFLSIFFCLFFWDLLSFQLFQKYSPLSWIIFKIATAKSLFQPLFLRIDIDSPLRDLGISWSIMCWDAKDSICELWILYYESQRSANNVAFNDTASNNPCRLQHPTSCVSEADFNTEDVFRAFAASSALLHGQHSATLLIP